MIDSKFYFAYLLERARTEQRPIWAIRLGLHSFLFNSNEIKMICPRLRYKRKLGSFIVNPYVNEKLRQSEESRYENYLIEMKSL
jgi:hypothetical protein